jgi:hypothetical protein
VAQAVSPWSVTVEARVRALDSPCRICSELALGLVFSEFFGYPPSIYHFTVAAARLSPPHEVCDSPDQAAHYHALGPKLWASSMTRNLAGKEERNIYFIQLHRWESP